MRGGRGKIKPRRGKKENSFQGGKNRKSSFLRGRPAGKKRLKTELE